MAKSNKIYLDYASATPIEPAVFSVMSKILKENFANSGSIHDLGVRSEKILEQSRTEVAKILGAHNDEIVFTSGATESNNLAILGIIRKLSELFFKKCFSKNSQKVFMLPHVVTTNIEHSSILEVCKYLEKEKLAEVTYVPVEKNGIVDSKKIRKALRVNTVLVSVMYANNEIGTIQPIIEIAKEIRHFNKINKKKIIFHTDATQAVNYLPINVEKIGIDLLSFNGGKIYGPKGIGVLYVRRKTPITKIIYGGEQEFGLRPGTENLSVIVGLAESLKITEKIKEKESMRLLKLRDYFIDGLKNKNFDISFALNGDLEKRLPNNINITISKIPSDLLVLELSARGIYISEKSACKSGDKKGSYVIEAICGKQEGSLRFSLGRKTSKIDIDYVLKSLSEILEKLKKWYN